MKTVSGKRALITGGSSGIGLAMAKQLAALGADIDLLARDPQKLEVACEEVSAVRRAPNQKVRTIVADVANCQQVQRALAPILQQDGAPDIVVNSAGITYPGEFEKLDLQIFRDMMEVNYFGTLHVLKEIIPAMKQRRSGRIINISSVVGIHGLYGYSAYSPSKFAVVGLSDALRYELKPYNIDISVAFPSDTQTPQLDFENSVKPPLLKTLSEGNTKASPAEDVARNILNSALQGRYLIFPNFDSRFLYFVYRLFPGDSMYKLVDLLMADARRKMAKNNRHQ